MSTTTTTDDERTRKEPTLTHKQAVNRLRDIADELERLDGKDNLSEEDEEYFDELRQEFDDVDAHRKALERRSALTGVQAALGRKSGPIRVERSGVGDLDADLDADPIGDPASAESRGGFRNPFDLSEIRTFNRTSAEVGDELRARALSAIEQMRGLNDARREAATKIIVDHDDADGTISRMALATGSPEYLRGFAKAAHGKESSQTAEERQAVQRAMSLVDAQGGYLVPFQLDPSVIITSDGSRNDIRRFARQVMATGDVWHGVSSGAVEWSWDAEAAEVSDDSTTFAQPEIPVHKAAGFVPISIEAAADAANVAAEVGRLLAFGKDSLEAVALATGSGSGQPQGIVTGITAGSILPTATASTFALADVYALQGAVPARYRANASWLGNNLIYNLVRNFDTAGGSALWERIGADRPPLLLGRSAGEAEAMAGTTTDDDDVLIFGDFSNYVIADRVGTVVEFVPHLFGSNQRPTGQRGWYAYFRMGAAVVNNGAFRKLRVLAA